MKLRLPAKNLMIIMCLLVILTIIGGCIFNKNSAVEAVLSKTDAWCEIQEFNLTIVQNRTIITVTEEDLKPFPEFGIYLMDINTTPPTGNTGTRVVKVIDCNSSRAIRFLTLYRKYEDFPHQPVLEYRGHFYEMGFEYLESHSTAQPTIPDPALTRMDTPSQDPGYRNTTAATVAQVLPPLCHGYLYSVPAGGDVYLGEGCLNVSEGISSEHVISWYKKGRKPLNDNPDENRIVHDARNFYVNPDEFLSFEGNWYVWGTDQIAFVVKDVTLNLTSGLPEMNATSLDKLPDSLNGTGKFDDSVSTIINSTNKIDYARVWVILNEPPGIPKDPSADMTMEEKKVFREQQRAYYLNYTKQVVDYVRSKGFVVDYISRTSPSFEVLAPPPFMEELAQQPKVQKIVVAKASHPLIREMLQRQPDETLNVGIYLTSRPGIAPEPDTPRTEQQMREWYAKNRVLFQIHTQPVLTLLQRENITLDYIGPYPMTAIYGNVPVHLLEEFNTRSDIGLIELVIPARLI